MKYKLVLDLFVWCLKLQIPSPNSDVHVLLLVKHMHNSHKSPKYEDGQLHTGSISKNLGTHTPLFKHGLLDPMQLYAVFLM